MKKLVIVFLIVFLFQACSWQECFVITNQCNTDIIVEYEICLITNGASLQRKFGDADFKK